MATPTELPEAIGEMIREHQRRRFHGHILVSFSGEVVSVVVKESYKPQEVIDRYRSMVPGKTVIVRSPQAPAKGE